MNYRKSLCHFPFAVILISLVSFWIPTVSHSQQLTRGPFIQSAGEEQFGQDFAATLVWRTDLPTNAVLNYGPSPQQLTSQTIIPFQTIDHAVRLSSISPGQTVYYEIGYQDSSGTTVPIGGGTTDHFIQAPASISTDALFVSFIGDPGIQGGLGDTVRDGYLSYLGASQPDLQFFLGDNGYTCGRQFDVEQPLFERWQAKFHPSIPMFALRGNHDGLISYCLNDDYFSIVTNPALGESGGPVSNSEEYFDVHWRYGNSAVVFIALGVEDSLLQPSSSMLQWLDQVKAWIDQLPAEQKRWVVGLDHFPAYSDGSHNSNIDPMLVTFRENVVRELAPYLDIMIAGHSHGYERSYFLDSNNSDCFQRTTLLTPLEIENCKLKNPLQILPSLPQPNDTFSKATFPNGFISVVTGSSSDTRAASYSHPFMKVSAEIRGIFHGSFKKKRAQFTLADENGVVFDRFSITKSQGFQLK